MKAKKTPRATHMEGIEFVDGWVLVTREKNDRDEWEPWHIAWLEIFSRKAEALKFATDNQWPVPFRAIRGTLSASP
jgi:hypothetical protein